MNFRDPERPRVSRRVSSVTLPLPPRGKRIAYLSTYLPRECGLSTFTRDLSSAVDTLGVFSHPTIIAVHDPDIYSGPYAHEVRFLLLQHDRNSYAQAATFVNQSDVALVNVQHEFGIFGTDSPRGTWDGTYVLDFLRALRKPAVVTLHTVLEHPNPRQAAAFRELGKLSARLVVMAGNVSEILERVYRIPAEKIFFIHHGAPDVPFHGSDYFKRVFSLSGREVLMTFGLLSPNKGVEYVLDALPEVVAKHPEVIYLIVGATHPVVRKEAGEVYRKMLRRRVREHKLNEHVRFVNQYLTLNQLILFLRATNIYLAPQLDLSQYVSGTLAYAAAFGKAIIATGSRYAQYLLADDRGLLVPARDARALAVALEALLGNPQRKRDVEEAIYIYSRAMTWPSVASQYADLFRKVIAEHNGLFNSAGAVKPVPRRVQKSEEVGVA
ncbi:MAG: group 1 glycosyl transferase [Parcubacteria group bacterium Gr01-1014_38]|nr:MAG: group 1 glycosyl transferase [Parcubacteria group bacterium Gr01-1014_38]